MKLQGEFVFDGSREEVWELVRDPEALATALPGTQSLDKVSENEYEGAMNVRVGPVSGAFSGRLVVSDEVPPESYNLMVEGRGGAGMAKGVGHVQLRDRYDGTTLMQYDGEIQVGGRLANVGQRMLETVSKSMTRQGLETLNRALQVRRTAKAEGRQVEYAPPSEAEFAAAVAKDMAVQVLSPEYRMVWVALAVAIVSVTIGYWIGRRR